ncbi:response regulator [Chelatococcus sp. GCM10030263]|uniref:response regulator n=1 Tax=Chelatococcus sp. GCM10030263 TaxID=3273387 RepID=UPI003611D70B
MCSASDHSHLAIVAEDEPLVSLVITATLEDAGHEVLAVSCAEEALNALSAHPDAKLLVTDVEMPGMDGFALTRAVREKSPSMIVVVVSGRQAPAKGDLPAGVRFLPKPFAPERLLLEIEAAAAIHPLRRQ